MASNYLQIVRTIYPDAIPTDVGVEHLLDQLAMQLKVQPCQIMAADSICSDDLNMISYPKRAYEMLGPFKMGGLNGFPFTGLTGMGAFAHHVPADGAVFVFYGPHIGVTRDGVAGEVHRPGQAKASSCCGAAKAALGRLQRNEIQPGNVTELDYQQNHIEQIFLAEKSRILAAPNPIVEATEVMYEAIEKRIDLLVSRTHFDSRYVILLGGVMINGDDGSGSFVSMRRRHLIDNRDGTRVDMPDPYLYS